MEGHGAGQERLLHREELAGIGLHVAGRHAHQGQGIAVAEIDEGVAAIVLHQAGDISG